MNSREDKIRLARERVRSASKSFVNTSLASANPSVFLLQQVIGPNQIKNIGVPHNQFDPIPEVNMFEHLHYENTSILLCNVYLEFRLQLKKLKNYIKSFRSPDALVFNRQRKQTGMTAQNMLKKVFVSLQAHIN